MTSLELLNKLNCTGVPFVVAAWHCVCPPPYGVMLTPIQNTFWADGEPYATAQRIRLEMYTDGKDYASEGKVEDALQGIPFTKQEKWIDAEQLYQIIYECEV